MPDFFHGDEISAVLSELKRTVQQGQIAVASVEELVRNINVVVQRADRILTKFEGVLK
jgi:hypothetical protein